MELAREPAKESRGASTAWDKLCMRVANEAKRELPRSFGLMWSVVASRPCQCPACKMCGFTDPPWVQPH